MPRTHQADVFVPTTISSKHIGRNIRRTQPPSVHARVKSILLTPGLELPSQSTVIELLSGATDPTVPKIRNELAHGVPFGEFPGAGLLELLRDLIGYDPS